MSEKIAVFGLGAMGSGIASNLLKNGYSVSVTVHRNAESVDALVRSGAKKFESKTEAVEQCDLVLLCLPNSEDVNETINETWQVLGERHLILDTGTSLVASTVDLAERLNEKSVQFAEAPLAGGKAQASAGELGAFVGADDAVFERVQTVLQSFCSSINHFGPVGSGGRAKLISNYLVLSMVRSIIETFHAAEILQIDWEIFYRTISRGSGNSMSLERIMGSIVDRGDYSGYVFSVSNALKDSQYIAELIEQSGIQSEMGGSALQLFENAQREGLGDLLLSELLREDVRPSLPELLNTASSDERRQGDSD